MNTIDLGLVKGGVSFISGHFQNRSLVANTDTILTPIIDEGDDFIINGNDFIVPEDGVYVFSSIGADFLVGSNYHSRGRVLINSVVYYSNTVGINGGVSSNGGQTMFPGVSITTMFLKEDKISFSVYSQTAQSGLPTTKFIFARLA